MHSSWFSLIFGIWNIPFPSQINQQAFFHSIAICTLFLYLRCLGENAHLVRQIRHQDGQGRNPAESPKNESLRTYCNLCFCMTHIVDAWFPSSSVLYNFWRKNNDTFNEFNAYFSTWLKRPSIFLFLKRPYLEIYKNSFLDFSIVYAGEFFLQIMKSGIIFIFYALL